MQKAIDNLVHNRTVIIIADRLSTIAGPKHSGDRRGTGGQQGTHAQCSHIMDVIGAVAGANGRARGATTGFPRLESRCISDRQSM